MRKEYHFTARKGRRNPYAKVLKKGVTPRLGVDVTEYFKERPKETGIPYQNLINPCLRECIQKGKKPALSWASGAGRTSVESNRALRDWYGVCETRGKGCKVRLAALSDSRHRR